MTMMANASPFSIPYASVVGTSVKFSFTDAMTMPQMLGTPGVTDPRHFTGGYLYWKNDTDFTLYGTYDTSGHQCFLLPGEGHFCPLNADDTFIIWILQAKNPSPVHPQALLHCQYLDKGDIASGHQVIAAVGLNPSTTAASLGGGALPPSVTDNNPDVFTPSTISAGVLDVDVTAVLAQQQTETGSTGITAFLTVAGGALYHLLANVPLGTRMDQAIRAIDTSAGVHDFHFGADDTLNIPGVLIAHFNGAQCIVPELNNGTADCNGVINIQDNVAGAIIWSVGKRSHANGDAFRVVDTTNGVSCLTVQPNNAGIQDGNGNYYCDLLSAGGGAAGRRLWAGTTDPAGLAVEGDTWVDA